MRLGCGIPALLRGGCLPLLSAIHWRFGCEGYSISCVEHKSHGLQGGLDEPDWPRLTLSEVDGLLRRYPAAGGARRLISYSPRPFSAASVVETPLGNVFVKRHAGVVRDREGLMEEHRLIASLAAADWAGDAPLVTAVLADLDGETVATIGDWTYEVHAPAAGIDVYEQTLSWTPFLHSGHARAAGNALARLHQAAQGYAAPARAEGQLISSYTIFAGIDPVAAMDRYLCKRPMLMSYAEDRNWRRSMDVLLLPFFRRLEPWIGDLKALWTHNDFHGSNLTWSGDRSDATVCGILDFGLADRTNAVHDLATAIERSIVEWLRIDEPDANLAHLDHLDALLAGYEELRPLTYEEARALAAIVPLVHCEFALSETDYFLSVLGSETKAHLAYEGYFLAHAGWFLSAQGQGLIEHLERWANETPRAVGSEI